MCSFRYLCRPSSTHAFELSLEAIRGELRLTSGTLRAVQVKDAGREGSQGAGEGHVPLFAFWAIADLPPGPEELREAKDPAEGRQEGHNGLQVIRGPRAIKLGLRPEAPIISEPRREEVQGLQYQTLVRRPV